MEHTPLLELRGVSKAFPGVRALDNVSLSVEAGTVHALMGENGAGKSTLMKCLFGVYSMDAGEIRLNGVPVQFKNSRDALDSGVAMVHQELNQALKCSVMDNIWLGRFPKKAHIMVDEAKILRDTKAIFNDLHIDVNPKAIMGTLPVAKRQVVEIAKAVSYNSKIIVFDEPTSSLTEEEVEHFFQIIGNLKAKGVGIIYISHKMAEIKRISDTITVMRDGVRIVTRPAAQMENADIIKAMVGRELTRQFPEKHNKPGEIRLEIKNLTGQFNILRNVSFNARKGEVLGLAGLGGSGRTETLESIFGMTTLNSGTILLDGHICKNDCPRHAIKNGFALLTEERRANGIFAIENIRDNTVLSSLRRHLKYGWLSESSMAEDTQRTINAMHTKTPSQLTQIRSLSGGNQQKVILGRWLLTEPEVLLLDEPTRGIDVGAKFEIYQLILDLASRGKTILMVSSEMPELLGICDRIIVMSNGRVAGEVDAQRTSQEDIMTLAAKFM